MHLQKNSNQCLMLFQWGFFELVVRYRCKEDRILIEGVDKIDFLT